MATLQVEISDSLKDFLDDRAAAEGCPSASAYLARVLEDLRRRQAKRELEALALEGVASGPSILADEEFWTTHRRRLLEKYPGAAPT